MEELGEDTEDLAEGFSKYAKEIKGLTGFDIMADEDTGSFKDLYDIMEGIAGVWDKLSDTQQARVAEILGGTRQLQVIASIIGNWSDAAGAYSAAMDSAGVATKANNIYMDTAQAKINQLKTTFQELSSNFANSDLIGGVANVLSFLLKIINGVVQLTSAVGGLKTVLLGVVSALVIINQQMAINAILKIKSVFTSLLSIFPRIIKWVKTLKDQIWVARLSWELYSQGVITANEMMQASIPIIGLALVAITALVVGISAYNNSVTEANQNAKNAANTASGLSDEISSLTNKYLELSDAVDTGVNSREELLSTQNELIEKLGLEGYKIKELTEEYGSYTEAIKAASIEKLKEQEINIRGGINAEKESVMELTEADIRNSKRQFRIEGASSDRHEQSRLYNTFKRLQEKGFVSEGSYEFETGDDGNRYLQLYHFLTAQYDDKSTVKDVVNEYDKLGQMLSIVSEEMGSENHLYEQLYRRYLEMQDPVNAYKDRVAELNKNLSEQYVIEHLQGKELPKTQEEFNNLKDSIVAAAQGSGKFIGSNEEIKYSIESQLKEIGAFSQFFQEYTNAVKEAEKTDIERLSTVQKLSSGLKQLSDIYKDVADGGDFDYSSILNNDDFSGTFKKYDSEYNNFIQTISSSPNDIAKCQDAFNSLVGAYLNDSDALQDVTEETKAATIAMLEQYGVVNASEIVTNTLLLRNEELYNSLLNVTEETKAATIAMLEKNGAIQAANMVEQYLLANKERELKYSKSFTELTYDECLALYQECTAGEAVRSVFAQIALEKIKASNTQFKTASDVDNLLALAKAAGASSAALNNLTRAKAALAAVDALTKKLNDPTLKPTNAYYSRLLDQIEQAKAEANKAIKDATTGASFTYKISIPEIKFNGGSSSSSSSSSSSKTETWFEKQLAEHKHNVAMEKETQEEYINWLETNAKKAYNEGILDLKDYRSYLEEVYKGRQSIFKDKLGDFEHNISLREDYENESKNILEIYTKLLKQVEAAIAAARKHGLTDDDDYIQDLQDKWTSYKDAIKKIEDEATDDAKDALDDLLDYQKDKLKQDVENQKDALDKKLDYLKEFYDKQKEMLQDQYDEEKYLKEQSEKRKTVSDISAQLEQLAFDNSAWAMKKKAELKQELADAQNELDEFEKEHALDSALDTLDKAYDDQEKLIQDQMDALSNELNDPELLLNKALEAIKNNTGSLYEEMLEYNRRYGTGDDADVKKTYEEAYKALLAFKQLFGKDYEGIDLPNSTGYKSENGSWNDSSINGNATNTSAAGTGSSTGGTAKALPKVGDNIQVKKTATNFTTGSKMASWVPGGSFKVLEVGANSVRIGNTKGETTGWIKISDIEGYASGTPNATAGIHAIDERGDEMIFESKDGSRYRVFSGGEKVLNAKATSFLYEFANDGGRVLDKIFSRFFDNKMFDKISTRTFNTELVMGDIIIQGNADKATVSEIRREQRSAMDNILKTFNRFNRQ